MSPFDFVFTLLSLIASLAVVHLVSAFVALIRNADRVRFSWLYALWMWVAFATTIGNWGSNWGLHKLTNWPAWMVLINIAMGIGQYAFCAFVAPELPREGEIDLGAIQMAERRRYLPAFLTLFALAIASNVLTADAYAGWLRDTLLSLVSAGFALLALLVPRRWAQYAAIVPLTLTTTYFLYAACAIGPG
jgi:hypothetical protein